MHLVGQHCSREGRCGSPSPMTYWYKRTLVLEALGRPCNKHDLNLVMPRRTSCTHLQRAGSVSHVSFVNKLMTVSTSIRLPSNSSNTICVVAFGPAIVTFLRSSRQLPLIFSGRANSANARCVFPQPAAPKSDAIVGMRINSTYIWLQYTSNVKYKLPSQYHESVDN